MVLFHYAHLRQLSTLSYLTTPTQESYLDRLHSAYLSQVGKIVHST